MLAHGVAEIEAAEPQPARTRSWPPRRTRLAHADALRLAARTAHDALLGDADDPATDAADVTALLGQAGRALALESGDDPALDAMPGASSTWPHPSADLGAELVAYGERLDADPERLAQVEARRAVLTGLTRKYGDDLDAVLDWAESGRASASPIWTSPTRPCRTGRRARRARGGDRPARCADVGPARTSGRSTGAGDHRRTRPVWRCRRRGRHRGPSTSDRRRGGVADRRRRRGRRVGATASTRSSCCSGRTRTRRRCPLHAERRAVSCRGSCSPSRSCLAGTDPVPTMVFDEVDAGVGGRAAVEVGRRLARLARDHQVIVVTHLPQVAAYADRHVVVDKPLDLSTGGVTRSDVRMVDGDRASGRTGADAGRARFGYRPRTRRRTAGRRVAEFSASSRESREIGGPDVKTPA